MMRCRFALCGLLWVLTLAASAGAEYDPWQGGRPEAARRHADMAASWLLLDTGGSGGMFGKGDLRSNLRDVAFWTDGRHGVAAGDAGAFYTSDGGLSWRRVRPHPRQAYPDESGIICYRAGISGPREIWVAEGKHPAIGRRLWHSTDAGESWEDAAERFPGKFSSVWDLLVRGPNVWLLGGWEPRASYCSANGGQSWKRLDLPESFEPFLTATPADQPKDTIRTVYLLGAGKAGQTRFPRLLRSDDGGETWREIPLPEPRELPWHFNRATIAFATPEAGVLGLVASGLNSEGHGKWTVESGAVASVLATEDGGRTWRRSLLPAGELYITALCLFPNGQGYAAVWNGFVAQQGGPRNGPALYRTPDAGRSWEVALRGSRQFNAIFALDTRRVWSVGDVVGFAANDLVAILRPEAARPDPSVQRP